MEKDWLNRLKAVIASDRRSLRQISLEAGLGPNFLQQMLAGKDPGVDKLQKLLRIVAPDKLFYVITGLEVMPDDLKFMTHVMAAPRQLRGPIEQIIDAVKDEQSLPEPPASGPASIVPMKKSVR